MKVHQVVLAVVDFDDLGADGVRQEIECSKILNSQVRSLKTVDIGEWSDDNPLNIRGKEEDELRRLFGQA